MRYFGKVRLGHKTVVEMSKQIVGAASSNNDKNAIKISKSIETCIYVLYICRSFYVFSSWFNYNNLLISHSNGTWYLLSSSGRLRARFLRLFFFGATSRELANDEGMQTGSRTGRKTLDSGGGIATLLSHGVRLRLLAEILRATYVILHACLVYIFYVICMKMLLEGSPVKI